MKDLVINADDLGISENVNAAIIYCLKQKLIDRTTLMVNMEYTDAAVEQVKRLGLESKVGLHINIVEGFPLTNGIKNSILCNEDGTFDEKVLKLTRNRLWLDKKTKSLIRDEIEAQFNRFSSFGLIPKFVDSHEHAHVSLSIWAVLKPLLSEYGVESVRLSRNIPRRDIHGFNLIYKQLINTMILHYNKTKNVLIDSFGSQDDVDQAFDCCDNYDLTEMMVHPIMQDGKLRDAFNGMNIKEWRSMHKGEDSYEH